MNNSKIFWPTLMLTFLLGLFALSVLSLGADWLHPRLPCMGWERGYWADRTGNVTFEKVSSYYWSSLCATQFKPLVISASEGTGNPSFPDLLSARGHQVDQFLGAHRGLKTFGYLAANDIHPERLKNLRALVLINPVYFSFAAHTDAASIRLNAISNLAYILRVHSMVQTWDEFFFESFYVSCKEYLEELRLFLRAPSASPAHLDTEPTPMSDAEFNGERNMMSGRTHLYTSFSSRFRSQEQPSRTLFELSVQFVKEHPETPVCLVMLPINVKNLRYFGRDSQAILEDMNQLFSQVPQDKGVNLLSFSETPKIFQDPMHLSAFGKAVVLDEVLKAPCAQRVFEVAR